ncbi:MAG: hypothetical protein ACSHYF_15830 [Verrucomicrobiaceae bacterium]
MSWIIIAYLLTLAFLTVQHGKFTNPEGLQKAWFFFSFAFFSKVVVTLFQVNNLRSSQDMMCGQLWQDALPCLFIGLSILHLSKCFSPKP